MKDSKKKLWIGAGWLVFMLIFWLLGKPTEMNQWTAFFGVVGLTALYAGLVYAFSKIKS